MESYKVYHPFATLISDAALFADLSGDPDLSASCARASILSGVFSVECAVKALLETTIASSRLRAHLDRLPVLAKAEAAVLYVNPKADFDRGSKPVQGIRELFQLRNRLVHPKSRKHEYAEVYSQTREGELVPFLQFEDEDTTNNLGICRRFWLWEQEDAQVALQAVDKFLEFLFLDLCSFSANESQEILLGEFQSPMGGGSSELDLTELHHLLMARETMSVAFRYLDLDSFLPPNYAPGSNG